MYRPVLAIVTSNRKLGKASRNMPAASVMGSPTIGTQLASSNHRPYRRYQACAWSSARIGREPTAVAEALDATPDHPVDGGAEDIADASG